MELLQAVCFAVHREIADISVERDADGYTMVDKGGICGSIVPFQWAQIRVKNRPILPNVDRGLVPSVRAIRVARVKASPLVWTHRARVAEVST